MVGWEATALAAAAMLAGLPLGLLAGRWSWALFAGALGVAGGADVPVLLVLLTVPVTWLLAILIAAWPARVAARVRPAAVLAGQMMIAGDSRGPSGWFVHGPVPARFSLRKK